MAQHQTLPTLVSGLDYMTRGFQLLASPGMKKFIIIPLIINLIIFIVLSYFIVQLFGDFNTWLSSFLPDWLSFLTYILWALLFILFLIGYGYSFTLLTNLIAAPLYGMLATQVEIKLTGKAPADEPLQAMIGRTIGREITKLCYFTGYGLLIFFGLALLSLIPLV
ncbi:MAG: EI24 domain-containing protein, partial [Gammaproteobacteria bacterium]|nr:EI24 domain-containing protein [Gammaproteobacteria bacterium]